MHKDGNTRAATNLKELASNMQKDNSDLPTLPDEDKDKQPALEDVLLPGAKWSGRIHWDGILGDDARNWYCDLQITEVKDGKFKGSLNMGQDTHGSTQNPVITGEFQGNKIILKSENNDKSKNFKISCIGELNSDSKLELQWNGSDQKNSKRSGTVELELKNPGKVTSAKLKEESSVHATYNPNQTTFKFSGTWIVKRDGDPDPPSFEVKGDGKLIALKNNSENAWTMKGDKIHVAWSAGDGKTYFVDFTVDSTQPDQLVGINASGVQVIWTRKK